MSTILIVVNNPKQWPFHMPGVEVVSGRAYLTKPEYGERRGAKVFNLSRSYRYQSVGYYVTLLATARGHKPLPSITTIEDLKSQAMVRFVTEDLDELIQSSLAPLQSEQFTLSIYFGRNVAKRYDRLSRQLFNLFRAPLLRAQFARNDHWQLRSVTPISMGDVPEAHRDFLLEVAAEYFSGKGPSPARKRAVFKYDLAILFNPQEELPPSDEPALRKFVKAAEHLGLRTELLEPDDFGRIAEFDALFIRETTRVNHHTYRFSRRAAVEGLVVIDDPESIVRCSNKVYLAELLQRHRVPTPKTLVVHRDNVDAIRREIGFPCVLKQPDSSFSQGVVKIEEESELVPRVERFLKGSDLLVVQEFLPTTFDWRIGVLDRRPLFACKYFMAHRHWQIYKPREGTHPEEGRYETLPVEIAPRPVVRAALRAANLIGDGFYGVDVKQSGKECYVLEVNDNPSVEAGVEDAVLRDELYLRVMSVFLKRIELKKAGIPA